MATKDNFTKTAQKQVPIDSEQYTFENWTIKYKKSHILNSLCTTPDKCEKSTKDCCLLCTYNRELKIPHLPEMVFASNKLIITHISGGIIEFNCLDALKTVSTIRPLIKVSCSEAWQESRQQENLEDKTKPFDWTFSCSYKGTISNFIISDTDEKINIEKLKIKEKILFYQEIMLYEDELHDNGISSCNLKIRVMPSGFFILLRYFLRIDNVLIRINDTRYYHDFSTDYILREYSCKECDVKEINLPLTCFGDPNLLLPLMPLKSSEYVKLTYNRTANNVKEN